jgi:hypothetical protein
MSAPSANREAESEAVVGPARPSTSAAHLPLDARQTTASETTDHSSEAEYSALPRFTDPAANDLAGAHQQLDRDRVLPQKESFHVETERALFQESATSDQAMLGSEYDLLQTEECEIDEEFGALVTALDDTERALFTIDAASILERFAVLQNEQTTSEASLIHPGLESLTPEQRYGLGAFMVTMIAEKESDTQQCYGHSSVAQTCAGSSALATCLSSTEAVSGQGSRCREATTPMTTPTLTSAKGHDSQPQECRVDHEEHPAEASAVAAVECPAEDDAPVRPSPKQRRRQQPRHSRTESNDASFAERYARLLLSGLGLFPGQVEALMYLWRACLEGELIPAQRRELVVSTATLIGAPAVRFAALQAMLTLSLSPGMYDARCRVFLRDAARELRLPWRKVALVEYAVSVLLQQQQQQPQAGEDAASVLGSWSDTLANDSMRSTTWELSTAIDADAYATQARRRYRRKSRRRAFKVAAMALGGGALFGLAGALAAPLLLPALVGIGITGASALAATGTVASGAVVGSFFGGLGAGYVGHKARKRTRMRLTDFELEPLGVEEAAGAWRQEQTPDTREGNAPKTPPDGSGSSCSSGMADVIPVIDGVELESGTWDADTVAAARRLEAAIRESLQTTLQLQSGEEKRPLAEQAHGDVLGEGTGEHQNSEAKKALVTEASWSTADQDHSSNDDEAIDQVRDALAIASLRQRRQEPSEKSTLALPLGAHPPQEQEQHSGKVACPPSSSPSAGPAAVLASACSSSPPQTDTAPSSDAATATRWSTDVSANAVLRTGQCFRRKTPTAMLRQRLEQRSQAPLPSPPSSDAAKNALTRQRANTATQMAVSSSGREASPPMAVSASSPEEQDVASELATSTTDGATAQKQFGTISRPRLTHSLHLAIFIPGWLTRSRQEGACASQFYSALGNGRLLPFAERFALRWEPGQLYEMGRAFLKFWTTKAATTAAQQAAPHLLQAVSFAAGALLSSIAWPLFVYSAADIVDGPWSVLLNRANAAGDALADMLALREHGQRPVTLIGYSHGARVVFKCLEALAEAGVYGVVDDAFLIGAPCTGDGRRWLRASRVVAGRLVNAYCGTDWALALFHRGSSGQFRVAGLSPIRGCRGRVENVNLALLGLEGHRSLREALPRILTALGVETGGLSFPPILPREVALLEETDPHCGPLSPAISESVPSEDSTIDGWSGEQHLATETAHRRRNHRTGSKASSKHRQRTGVADEHGRQWKRDQYDDPSRHSIDGDDRACLLLSTVSSASWTQTAATTAHPWEQGSLRASRDLSRSLQETPLISIDSDSESRAPGQVEEDKRLQIEGESAAALSPEHVTGAQHRNEVFVSQSARADPSSPSQRDHDVANESADEDIEWTAFMGVAPAEPERDTNVLVHALGIEVAGGRFLPLIEAGTRYPCERTVTVTTCVDRQDAIAFFIYQGSRPRLRPLGAKDARRHHRLLKIIEFHDFTSPVRHRAGGARVELALTLDEHGALEVSVRDIRGDAKTSATIPASMLVRRRDAFDSDEEAGSGQDEEEAEPQETQTGALQAFQESTDPSMSLERIPGGREAALQTETSVLSGHRPRLQEAPPPAGTKTKRSKWWSWGARSRATQRQHH